MLAQLVEDLVHLERERDDLDEDGGFDRATRDVQLVLRPFEDLVPQARLAVALELRQVEIRTGPLRAQTLGVVEEIEAEVEEGAGDRLTLHEEVLLVEVPTARANDEGRGLL